MQYILGSENSLINQFISEIRDAEIQKDRMRFRRNMERLGEVFAYEISEKLIYKTKDVSTPLGVASVPVLSEFPIIATILRAGLPIHHGLLNFFDQSDNAFVSAFRKHRRDGSFEISIEYISCPSIEGRTLILSDPMLATGSSMVTAYRSLMEKGKPAHTHIVTAIASADGLKYVKQQLPEQVTLWVGAVDEELTAQSYIVPGLGDAGDLAFGEKE